MKRTTRRLLITAAVIVGVVILLSVAVRLVLTRDVLMELIVPRLETAVGAEISVEDISVRFPFGFGVDIRGLAFEKPMPQGENLTVGTERLVAKASLISLIKKKPVIQSVDVAGGSVRISGGEKASEVHAAGIVATLSMKPLGEAFRIAADLEASTVRVSAPGRGPLALNDLSFEGDLTLDGAYRSLRIERAEAGWGDLVSFAVSGDITELKTERNVGLRVVSERIELPPLVERIMMTGMMPGAPGGAGKEPPLKLTKGFIALECDIGGSLQRPSTLAAKGRVGLKDVTAEHPLLQQPVTAAGDIEFDMAGARAEKVTVKYGSSSADISFDAALKERTKIDAVKVSCSAVLELEDLVPADRRGTLGMRGGKVTARVEFEGTPADVKALFPPVGAGAPVSETEGAWKRSRLAGAVEFGGIDVASPGSPLRVSGLKGKARFAKGDLESFEASFSLNGSPYSCAGSIERLMPALMEMKAVLGGANAVPYTDLGTVFQRLQTRSLVSARIEGRSFDATIFQEKGAGPEGRKQEGAAGAAKDAPGPLSANPFTLLALKGSAFRAHLDTMRTAKAVFTKVDAQGSIVQGRLRADPVTLQYAGGTGRAVLEADLRKPNNIKSKVDLSLDQVQAATALSAIHPLGRLLGGVFSFKADASFESGPELNPLLTLNGKGSALSTAGTLDLSSFLSPITQSGLIDLSHLERIDFKDWRGNFVMTNGRFVTENWTIKSNRGDWAVKGSFGIDGTIDYKAHLVVPPAVQQNMKDLSKYRDLVELFRDESGNLVLDLEIGGTSTSPRVSLDMSAAKAKAAEKAAENLIDRAKDWLKKK